MAIEITKIKWFDGLSPMVKCANCIHWKRHMSSLQDPEPSTGTCDAKTDMMLDDFYCKYFELKQDINVG